MYRADGTPINPKKDGDSLFLGKASSSGWDSGGGWQTAQWNAPAKAPSPTPVGASGSDVKFETKLPQPEPTPTAKITAKPTSTNFVDFGSALSGAQQFQQNRQKNSPWDMDKTAFDMAGVGDLMNMVGRMRSAGGG